MDLGSAVRVLLRRWIVVLIGVIMTLGAAGYLYVSTPPTYAAGARMLLLLPNNARGPDVIGSPFLYLPSGLEVIARLVAGAPATRAFQQAKAAEGLDAAVEVSVDNRSPMLIIDVTGEDPDDVLATRDWVVDSLQEELRLIQVEEGAPSAQIAHGRVFGAEDVPRSGGNSWMRPVLAVVAVGGIVTLIAAFSIDFAMQRRRRRRTVVAGGHEPDGDGEPDPSAEDPADRGDSARTEESVSAAT